MLPMLVFCLLSQQLMAQTTVSGTVKTVGGDPLAGVMVVNPNNKKSYTLSDANGAFTIADIPSNGLLEFSMMGYRQITVQVNNQTSLSVVMEEDNTLLEEVVVIGYGRVKKSDLTGSVSSIKTDKINDSPANSIEGLLQGRAAGLQVINSSQDPGAGSTVRIRGSSSLRGSNAPLLVVDGFPVGEAGDLKQVNPNDIASIEVLKDASASAIYGSRGANGVIMITTNKAKEGITRVNVKHQTTASQFTKDLIRWRDPVEMATLANESRTNAGQPPLYNGAINAAGVYYPTVNEIASGAWPYFTRWDKVVLRDLPMLNNTSVSINSATDRTSFILSGNFYNDLGVYKADDYTKGLVRLNVDHKVWDNFTIRTSNTISKNERNYNNGRSYSRNPIWPIYNEDGSYFLTSINDQSHPVALREHSTNVTGGKDYLGSLIADIQLASFLNLKSQVNYKYGNTIRDRYNPKIYSADGTNNNGAAYIDNWEGENLTVETYATFDKIFAEKHNVNFMLGHSYGFGKSRFSNLAAYDFVNETLGNQNLYAGVKQETYNGYSEEKLLSFLGRANYSFDNKYLFTATMRADGSSKFGANNKWGYFPSVAGSWKAHEEEFIKSFDIFNEMKLRVSWGKSGNQGISPYQTLSRYGTEKYFYNGTWQTAIGPGYEVGREGDSDRFIIWGGIPNEDLKWETTAQTNIGLDMGFFDNRLRVTLDLYYKKTTDLLRESFLSLSSGYNKIWINDGEVENRGIEISIDGNVISRKDFKLSANFIFSLNRNKVVSLGDAVSAGLQIDYITGMKYEYWGTYFEQWRGTPNILAVGQPAYVFYGYKTDGMIQTTQDAWEQGLTGDLAKLGEFKYLDISGDGYFDDRDRTIIGDPNPDFTASLSLNGSYKNFDFEVFLNGVFGNDVIQQNKYGQSNTMSSRWTLDNPTNAYPSLRENRQFFFSDWYITDGSFLRIQNVSIGYNFQLKNVTWIKNLRISANIANLYTFTKFKGYDPEVGTDGIYWGGYPRFRKWTLGVDITF